MWVSNKTNQFCNLGSKAPRIQCAPVDRHLYPFSVNDIDGLCETIPGRLFVTGMSANGKGLGIIGDVDLYAPPLGRCNLGSGTVLSLQRLAYLQDSHQ